MKKTSLFKATVLASTLGFLTPNDGGAPVEIQTSDAQEEEIRANTGTAIENAVNDNPSTTNRIICDDSGAGEICSVVDKMRPCINEEIAKDIREIFKIILNTDHEKFDYLEDNGEFYLTEEERERGDKIYTLEIKDSVIKKRIRIIIFYSPLSDIKNQISIYEGALDIEKIYMPYDLDETYSEYDDGSAGITIIDLGIDGNIDFGSDTKYELKFILERSIGEEYKAYFESRLEQVIERILSYIGEQKVSRKAEALEQIRNLRGMELYEAFTENNYLEPVREPVLSENPNAPTIVIVGDTHGSPTEEYTQLMHLRDEFGINFVGLEGWAGIDADKERGYSFLNAEEKLVKKLIDDNHGLNLVGLETITTQEEVVFKLTAYYLLNIYLESEGGNVKNLVVETEDESISAAKRKNNEILEGVKSIFIELHLPFTQEGIDELSKEIYEKYGGNYQNDKERAEELFEKFVVGQRSIEAARIFTKAMQDQKIDRAVIVIGSAHIDLLTEELQKLQDCNVIVVR